MKHDRTYISTAVGVMKIEGSFYRGDSSNKYR